MSIKGFLEVQEMQEGGPAMFTPFPIDPEGSPRSRIAPTYDPDPAPTIELPPPVDIPLIPTQDAGNISADASYNINMALAQAGADRDGLGPINPHWSQEFLSTLEARGRGDTPGSLIMDNIAKALVTPVLTAATLAVPAIAPMTGLFSAVTGRGVTGGLANAARSFLGGKTATPATPVSTMTPAAQTAAYQGTPATSLAEGKPSGGSGGTNVDIYAPGGAMDQARGNMTGGSGGAANVNIFAPGGAMDQARANQAGGPTPAFASLGTVGVGVGMFGRSYGMGGEISRNFAIGSKGSFSSFAHYGAGISQADEISIVSNSALGVFASPESGKDAVDGLVSGGYSESEITAIAQTGEYAGLDYAEGSKDDGSSQSIGKFAIDEGKYQDSSGGDFSGGDKVICQELYDQGLLEHSIYSLDEQFGEQLRKHDTDLLEGYHTWAYNVVDAMRKSKTITHIVRIVSRPVVKHIAYKMGYPSKTLLGAVMFNVGAFVCRRLAKKETVYA